MNDLRMTTVKLDGSDRKLLRRLSRRLGVSKSDAIRWAIRYYAIYGPCWPEGDTFPGETLREYGRCEIGPNGQEVHP